VRAQLSIEDPLGLSVKLAFTMEGMEGLPQPVDVSACVDVAYYEGIDPMDFNMWAISMQLVGFGRLYVPDQYYYRQQYASAAHSHALRHRLVTFGHDTTSRYLRDEQHRMDRESTFTEIISNMNADVATCLHERWYDGWVFMSMSPDEFFTFIAENATMLPKHPTAPTPLISEYIERYQAKITGGRAKELPLDALGRRWPCQSAMCITVHMYAEPNLTEHFTYEQPSLNASQRPHKRAVQVARNVSDISRTPLSIEVRTARNGKDPPHGASRKCWYRPDWRSMEGFPQIRIHGYSPDGCTKENWLSRSKACLRATQAELRPICWELCGIWGKEKRLDVVPAHSYLAEEIAHIPACGASASERNLRYNIRLAKRYRGAPSAHLPACEPTDPTLCEGPELERAHMRGGREGRPAMWLSSLGHTRRKQLASAVAQQEGAAHRRWNKSATRTRIRAIRESGS
jgi:hypothetical protein